MYNITTEFHDLEIDMKIAFLGHSKLYDCGDLGKKVEKNIIDNIIKDENMIFYCGGYGDFDVLCAGVCRAIKQQNTKCEVVLVTPYMKFSRENRVTYQIDHNIYDSILYPPLENVPLRFAVSKRNEWMVNEADLIIAYVKYSYGGAFKSLEYARRRKKHIINLAE